MSRNSKVVLINLFTAIRILGIPFIFMLTGVEKFLLVNALFITDFFDGYLARRYDATSKVGGYMDLIADKTIVIVLLIDALMRNKLSLLIVLLIIFREIISMVIRVINNKQTGETIPPSMWGKTKTTFQFIAFDFMILNLPLYHVLFWIVVFLGYYSLIKYLKIFSQRKELK